MATRLTIKVPGDYILRRDLCSYGYFLLLPNVWDPRREVLTRTLDLERGPAVLRITQPSPRASLRALADRALTRREQDEARRQMARMLRLDEAEAVIADFHAADPRFKPSGRAASCDLRPSSKMS